MGFEDYYCPVVSVAGLVEFEPGQFYLLSMHSKDLMVVGIVLGLIGGSGVESCDL